VKAESRQAPASPVSGSFAYVAPVAVARDPWKRSLDVVASSLMLAVLSPVFLAVAVAVKVSSKGPALYKGKRVGLSGQVFDMVKFRSMYLDADRRLSEVWQRGESDAPVFKLKDDPRVTPVGRFIRKYSLDELPQLLNVLKGEMSLVGPRALPTYEVELLPMQYHDRFQVKPGVTCYWQISGRSNLSFEDRMALDKKYLQHAGVWTDVKILAKTPAAVLRGEGAY